MDLDRQIGLDSGQTVAASRKKWQAPRVRHLRAGSAESRVGARVFDNPLEAQGS